MIRRLSSAILVVAFAFTPLKAHAVTEPDAVAERPSSDENLLEKYLHDMYSPFTNPMTLSIFAGGTLSTLTLLATHKDFEDKLLEDAAKDRPLGRTAVFGDVMGQMVPNVAYTAWFAGRYLITKDPLALFRAEMMFRATLAATSMSTILKATVREPRPSNPHELTSFPSGHTTSIFSFATIVAAMHGRYWGVGAYALAGFVAFSRMNDNRHRLHDITAGATIGAMYGLAIYDRMLEKAAPSVKTAFQYEITPMLTDDGAMLGLAATF